MNFEFMKGLRGLGDLYDNCSNAEKLVRTMPAQSIFTSRNCAELLAKFLYLAACNQRMEQMTFADILSDLSFKDFIKNRDVMNAFHYIRKQGNQAAHEENQNETVETAIDVLQDLHYLTGEAARMLGLIKKYPPFEKNIKKYPNAIYINDDEINEEALAMFRVYTDAFDAALEREKYEDLSDYELFDYALHGNADFHEYFECLTPMRGSFVADIQSYLLDLLALEDDTDQNVRAAKFKIELLIEGDKLYSTAERDQLIEAVENHLPSAAAFIIDILGSGKLRRFYSFEDDENDDLAVSRGLHNLVRKDRAWDGYGLLDKMEFMKRRANFIYKFFAYYPDCDEMTYHKIENGKDIDIWSMASSNIVSKHFDRYKWGHALHLWLNIDPEEYPEQIEQLHGIVRKHIPETELGFCEETWDDGDPQCLCMNVEWDVTDFKPVQTFLDEINQVIMPMSNEIDPYTSGLWVDTEGFFVAKWIWTDDGFKVIGTEY